VSNILESKPVGIRALVKNGVERLFPTLGREIRFRAIRTTPISGLADQRTIEPELLLIKPLVGGATGACIDVGAHVGEYCYALARCVPPGQVHAFEPNPETCQLLHRLFPEIRVWNVALSDVAGSARLSVPTVHGRSYPTRATLEARDGDLADDALIVSTRTLDEVASEIGRPIDFIKIDVEGHESKVLAGGRATMLRDRPSLLVELEQRHSSGPLQEKIREIEGLGYAGFFLDVSLTKLRPIGEFDVDTMQREENLKSARYVNNFFFFPVANAPKAIGRLEEFLAGQRA